MFSHTLIESFVLFEMFGQLSIKLFCLFDNRLNLIKRRIIFENIQGIILSRETGIFQHFGRDDLDGKFRSSIQPFPPNSENIGILFVKNLGIADTIGNRNGVIDSGMPRILDNIINNTLELY